MTASERISALLATSRALTRLGSRIPPSAATTSGALSAERSIVWQVTHRSADTKDRQGFGKIFVMVIVSGMFLGLAIVAYIGYGPVCDTMVWLKETATRWPL